MAIQFKNIERGNPVWILDKSELMVMQGKVTENQPHIDNTFTMTGTAQMMRDVTVDAGEKATTYTIPETLCVTYAGNLVLSTDQQGLSAEVERMKTQAEQVLASVERNKEIIAKAGDLLATLNPQIRERQETEKRFKSIEGDISGIRGMVQQLLDKLK